MPRSRLISEAITLPNFPLIDSDFDRFEISPRIEENLREEAEKTSFYHDTLDPDDMH